MKSPRGSKFLVFVLGGIVLVDFKLGAVVQRHPRDFVGLTQFHFEARWRTTEVVCLLPFAVIRLGGYVTSILLR